MVYRHRWVVFLWALMAGASPAFAQSDAPDEPRIWVLQDDSIIQGTLMEETPEDYLVNTALGEIRVNKADLKVTPTPLKRTDSFLEQLIGNDSYIIPMMTAEALALGLYMFFDIEAPGVATHLLGGSFVHLYHGHPGRALASLALRAGLPFACSYAFDALRDHHPWAKLLGFGVGILWSSLIDIFLLTDLPPDSPLLSLAPAPLSAIPSLSVTPKGTLTFGLAGHF